MAKKDYFLSPTANTPHGILAKLWRTIVIDTGNLRNLSTNISNYRNQRVGQLANSKTIENRTDSQLRSEVNKTELTWNSFIFLVFKILNARRITITISITHANGKTSDTSITTFDNASAQDDAPSDTDETTNNNKET